MPYSHRAELRKYVPFTDGVPTYLVSTVKLLQAGFPDGMKIDTPDYFALWSFLDNEEFTFRAIASAMDFAFNLKYKDVYNANGLIEDLAKREREIARIEAILKPLGLEACRAEEW
ncbi:MAG: hypothetical protein AAGH88_14180 [Planctomycetota bacterium]